MNKSATIVLAVTVVLVVFTATTSGCGGYKLEVDYIRNCDTNNVIELSKDFTMKMTDNCLIQFVGCITAHANITSAEVDYTVEKDIVKHSGKKDGCNQLENRSGDIESGLSVLGLPKSCPIYKGTVCMLNKSIDVSKYKLQMNVIAGRIKGRAVTTTNAGKSCVEMSAKLVHVLMKALPSITSGIIG